jgi:hypothetical protein
VAEQPIDVLAGHAVRLKPRRERAAEDARVEVDALVLLR